jgi:hypothetical protein
VNEEVYRAGNNTKLKQILVSNQGEGVSRFKALQQSKLYGIRSLVCEVDSSKMREDTSSLEYDDQHQENLYNLTLSSKI